MNIGINKSARENILIFLLLFAIFFNSSIIRGETATKSEFHLLSSLTSKEKINPISGIDFPHGRGASFTFDEKGYFYLVNEWTRGNGIVAINVKNPSKPQYIGGVLGMGYPRSAVYNKGFIYVPTWFSLLVIDVRNPEKMSILRNILFDFSTHSICARRSVIVKDKLYISGKTGLRIMDISSPDSPVTIAFYREFKDIKGIHVSNGLTFLNRRNHLEIIRIKNNSYKLLSEFEIKGIKNIAVFKDIFYVLTRKNQLKTYNISDVEKPVLKDTLNHIVMIKKINATHINLLTKDNKIIILDLKEPLEPKTVREIQIPKDINCSYIDFDKDIMFNLDKKSSLIQALDISKGKAELLGYLSIVPSEGGIELYNKNIIISYANKGKLGLFIIDPSKETSAPLESLLTIDIPNGEYYRVYDVMPASAIKRVKNYLLVGNGLVEIKSSSKLSIIKPITKLAAIIQVSEKYGYVALKDKLIIENIENIPDVKVVGEYRFGDKNSKITYIAIEHEIAYLINGKILELLNISNPKNIYKIGHLAIPEAVTCVISGKYLYLPSFNTCPEDKGLSIIDISNPQKPVIIKKIKNIITNRCRLIKIYDKKLYFIDNPHGIKVLDISDPLNPKLTACYRGKKEIINIYSDFNISDKILYGRRYSGVDRWKLKEESQK